MSLVAVGTVAFDDIETPTGRAEKIVGGACTYIALSASYFVKPVRVVSVVGDDFPTGMLEYLKKRGADHTHHFRGAPFTSTSSGTSETNTPRWINAFCPREDFGQIHFQVGTG